MSFLSKAERAYIQSGILASPASRADGRSLLDYRTIALETGIAPLANGSARVSIGRDSNEGGGGTEVVAASKLEVENIGSGEGQEGGRIICNVSCSPAAYPLHSTNALEDLQYDLTTLLQQTITHPSLHPRNLSILPKKKSWLLSLDVLVLSDAGNIYDALFIAASAALWDTKVPRTRSVEYKATKRPGGGAASANSNTTTGDMDVDQDVQSGFDTRTVNKLASDFELPDYWDEGEVLDGREKWPICVTLNLESSAHYLDASLREEAATGLKLLLIFSYPSNASPRLQATRTVGAGELALNQLKELLKAGETYAKDLHASLTSKLKDEDMRRNQKVRERFEHRR